MNQTEDSTVFQEFKERYQNNPGSANEAEGAFFTRMVPSITRMARSKLTSDVRRLFDTNDITSTVMRRVVSHLRSGQLKLETEGQFKSLLDTMTKHAINDKHDYLHGLLRDQSRTVSLNSSPDSGESTSSSWDLTADDDNRLGIPSSGSSEPIDELLLAEKIKSLNQLCAAIRKYLGSPDDWELFRLRFFEELSWEEIGRELEMKPDAARIRMRRNMEALRPRLQEYKKWLDGQP